MGYLWVHSPRARTTGGGLAAEGGGGGSSAPWWRRAGGVVMGRLGPGGSVGGGRHSWGSGCGSGGPERGPPRSSTGGNGTGGMLSDGEEGVRLWKRRNGEEKTNLASLDG